MTLFSTLEPTTELNNVVPTNPTSMPFSQFTNPKTSTVTSNLNQAELPDFTSATKSGKAVSDVSMSITSNKATTKKATRTGRAMASPPEISKSRIREPMVAESEVDSTSSTHMPSLAFIGNSTITNTSAVTSSVNQDLTTTSASGNTVESALKSNTPSTAAIVIILPTNTSTPGSTTAIGIPSQVSMTSDADTTDQCKCGVDKPKTDKRTALCKGCKKVVCMFRGCQERYTRETSARIHQKNHTPAEIEEFKNFRKAHCPCGAVRTKVPGKDYGECTKCARTWCTRGECSSNFTNRKAAARHKYYCPFGKSQFAIKCSKCGYYPKTRVQQIEKCPKCKTFWCSAYSCPFESDKKCNVATHQAMAHLIF